MHKKIIFLIFIVSLYSCSASKVTNRNNQLLKTDEAFSGLSMQRGMKFAFLAYMDSSAVILRNNSYPVEGKNAFHLFQSINDTSFQLTWTPMFAQSSHNLGYTYGTYSRTTKTSTTQGTYVTIWKKQKNGSWKFVLDTGNEGLGKE